MSDERGNDDKRDVDLDIEHLKPILNEYLNLHKKGKDLEYHRATKDQILALLIENYEITNDADILKAADILSGTKRRAGRSQIDDYDAIKGMAHLKYENPKMTVHGAAKIIAKGMSGQSYSSTVKRLVRKYPKQPANIFEEMIHIGMRGDELGDFFAKISQLRYRTENSEHEEVREKLGELDAAAVATLKEF